MDRSPPTVAADAVVTADAGDDAIPDPTAAATGPDADDADTTADPDGSTAGSPVEDRAAEPGPDGRPRRLAVPVALGVLAVTLAVLAGFLAVGYQRAQARSAAETEVLAPAKTAAVRILSYDYRHIQQDAAAAAEWLTGTFRGQYETVMRQQVVPQAPRQRAVVAAEVLAAGVSGISTDGKQAFVVVFANQTVSNTATRQPRVDQVRVRLTLDRVGDRWLVSKVDAL